MILSSSHLPLLFQSFYYGVLSFSRHRGLNYNMLYMAFHHLLSQANTKHFFSTPWLCNIRMWPCKWKYRIVPLQIRCIYNYSETCPKSVYICLRFYTDSAGSDSVGDKCFANLCLCVCRFS